MKYCLECNLLWENRKCILMLTFSRKSINVMPVHFYSASRLCLVFFLDSRKSHFPESVFCGSRWMSKTLTISGSYKRCTPWLELETCCADLRPFAITLRPLRTRLCLVLHLQAMNLPFRSFFIAGLHTNFFYFIFCIKKRLP
jgi:hypothetical protein